MRFYGCKWPRIRAFIVRPENGFLLASGAYVTRFAYEQVQVNDGRIKKFTLGVDVLLSLAYVICVRRG